MATVSFLYRSTKSIAPLNLRLLYRSNGVDYSIGGKTNLQVSKEYWSNQHKLSRPRDIDIINKQTEVRKELLKIEEYVMNSFACLEPIQQVQVDKQWLTTTLFNYYNPPTTADKVVIPDTLIEYIEYYQSARKNELSNNSIKKIKVVKRKLERFSNNKPIYIKDIDLNFATELTTYLLKEGYASNTITRDIRYLKTFCNHAKYNGIETSYQLEKVQAKYTPTKSIYLTTKEIELIESIKDGQLSEHLENARKWLLLSCYTGQRISDFLRFNMEMVRYEQNTPLLEFTQKKTGKIMTISLSSRAIKLLQEQPRKISDQKYNNYIKIVCEKAGIDQLVKGNKKVETEEGSGVYRKKEGMYKKCDLVSSHIGRRSFATNNYAKGIPTALLKNATGHSTESMFLEYIGKSNKDLALELSKHLG